MKDLSVMGYLKYEQVINNLQKNSIWTRIKSFAFYDVKLKGVIHGQ